MSILEHNSLTITTLKKKIEEMETRVDEVDEKVKSTTSSSNKLDDIRWNTYGLFTPCNGGAVAYGKDKFVAVISPPAGNASVYYSVNCKLWTTQGTIISNRQWRGVAYGKDKFVAIAPNSDVAAYSEDGITWTETPMPSGRQWNSIVFGGGKFVVTDFNGDAVAYSDDGITWLQGTMPSVNSWSRIAYGYDRFVALAGDYNTAGQIAAYSADGVHWEETQMPASRKWVSLAYGNGRFAAFSNSAQVGTSVDGIHWEDATMNLEFTPASVTFGNGRFVAVSGTKTAWSVDGISWTHTSELNNSGEWCGGAYGNETYVFFDRSNARIADGIEITFTRKLISIVYPVGIKMEIDPSSLPSFELTVWQLSVPDSYKRVA